ncbi:MAG TPA: glycosyltransferase family 4 protein [Gemmatimonadaceae bacterium]|nr:glycosyltransferase family 4 protein [Gemmatimonadaceae bacterium]
MPATRSLLWVNHFAVAPVDGGGTRHVEIARELVRRGWQVTIAASDFHLHSRGYTRRRGPSDRSVIRERVDGVEIDWLWAAPYSRNDWRRALNWLTFSRSVTWWRPAPGGRQPNVIIGSSPHLLAAAASLRLARRLGVPFLFEVRDLWPESLLAAGGRKGLLYYALDAIARRLYRSSDRIIVLAQGVGEYLATRGVPRSQIVYVPNGADVDPAPSRPRQADGSRLTAVYAGAHGPANGLDTVVDAAALLRDDPRIRFLLVGDGPSKNDLVARARARSLTNMEFREPVPKDQVAALLLAADLGLMVLRDAPLFSFGVSPNKLFDYMAAGLPIVCNVPGEVADILRQAGSGVQATDSSPEALASAVRRVAALDPAARSALGAAGRSWVVANNSREALAARVDEALRPLVGDPVTTSAMR